MEYDPVVALRIVTNDRLRGYLGDWGETRDLGGALVTTSDSPLADLNCVKDIHGNERNIDALLDVGFALLRAFDREPAARVTPLDRPRSLEKRLKRRGLRPGGRRSWMALRDGAPAIRTNGDVNVRVAEFEDTRTFADIHSAGEKWVRKMSVASTLDGMRERGNIYYLGEVDGQAVGTAHLLIDGRTAGIYALATMRAYRRRGVSTTLIARTIADARAAGCDVISLSTQLDGEPERLYGSLGFERVFESVTWVGRG